MKLSEASYGGIQTKFAVADPPTLSASAGRFAIRPGGEMQGILTKANKRDTASSREIAHVMICNGCCSAFCGPQNPEHAVTSVSHSGWFRHLA
jgi:hypothetical protein